MSQSSNSTALSIIMPHGQHGKSSSFWGAGWAGYATIPNVLFLILLKCGSVLRFGLIVADSLPSLVWYILYTILPVRRGGMVVRWYGVRGTMWYRRLTSCVERLLEYGTVTDNKVGRKPARRSLSCGDVLHRPSQEAAHYITVTSIHTYCTIHYDNERIIGGRWICPSNKGKRCKRGGGFPNHFLLDDTSPCFCGRDSTDCLWH